MKVISNFKSLTEELSSTLETELNAQNLLHNESVTLPSAFTNTDLINDSGEQVSAEQLISCLNAQFDMLYKTNHQRKYLIKEVSSYLRK